MSRRFIVLLAAVLSACASKPDHGEATFGRGPHLGVATDVVVTGTGIDKWDEPLSQYACETHQLTPTQARAFLNDATIVTGMEIHDVYYESPCFVEGTAKFRGISAKWKIRKFGTGYVNLAGEYVFSIVDEKNAPRIEHEKL